MTSAIITALDALVQESHRASLPVNELIRIQTGIAAYRYTLGELVTKAEEEMLQSDHQYDRYILVERISLQAEPGNGKLAHNKATDIVTKRPAAEELWQMALRAKIEHAGIKHKLHTSGDVLSSLSQRIKQLQNEAVTSRFQTSHP